MYSTKINQRKVSQFVDCITSDLGREFSKVKGKKHTIVKTAAHDPYPSRISDKSFLGKFYNFFIKKVICNVQNVDMTNETIDNYASIFPFRVDANLSYAEPAICAVLDDKFDDEIASFLGEHFDSVDGKKTTKLFLTNIHQHREQNEPINLKGGGDESVEEKLSSLTVGPSSLPRLNSNGIRRFQTIRDTLKKTLAVFQPERSNEIPFQKYDSAYFENLPETNISDLYSLLDAQFYTSDRAEYASRFKKYLFFFVHACRRPRNPVFFVDDPLYECLKSMQTVKISRADAEQLKAHIALLVCVFMRRIDSFSNTVIEPAASHMKSVSRYLNNLPAVRTGIADYRTDGVYPENWIYLCTNYEAIDVCFAEKPRDKPVHFTNLIIAAALSPKPITTLSIYNVYHGAKTSMDMPTNKQGIVNFVRKYNAYDGTKKAKPEYFLAEDFQGCFPASAFSL